jgi:hypothetical protein
MKNLILYFFLLGIGIFCIPSYQTSYARTPTPREFISLYALQYGAVESELLKVATCESGLNPNALHKNDGKKGNHSVGIFQYQRQTWERFSDLMGEDLDYYSYADQAKITAFVFANYPQLKSHWTCSKITKVI